MVKFTKFFIRLLRCIICLLTGAYKKTDEGGKE